MIKIENGLFYLETDHTVYAFQLLANGYLQHLYYGEKENCTLEDTFCDRNANVRYSKDYPYCLENIPLEYSSVGKGDVREPLVVVTRANGLFTGDFVYQSHSTAKGNLGHELNLMLLSDEEREAIRQQVAWYKENRELLQFGQLIRTDSGWIIRDGDKQLEFKLQEVSYTDQ